MTQKGKKWIISVFFLVVTLIFSLQYHYRVPYLDHWDTITLYASLKNGTFVLGDLFLLHGPHWHASGYAVLLALAEVTAMEHWAESLASVVFAALGFLALARMLDRCIGQTDLRQSTLWIYGISAFLYFSLDQAANWLWGWQVAVFISNAGALWAIERLTKGVPTLLNTTLAAVATAISVYGFGTAWTLIPIGFALLILFGAYRSREGIYSLALWSALSALLLFHFFSAFANEKSVYIDQVPITLDFLDVTTYIGLTHFAVNFIASPLIGNTMRDVHITVPVTLIGLGILIWSVRALNKDRKTSVLLNLSPFLSLAIFALGSGLLTALGRWEEFGANQAFVDRHVTFGQFFWIAVFVLGVLALVKRGAIPEKRSLVVFGLWLLFVLKITNIPGDVREHVERSIHIKEVARILSEDYPDVKPTEYSRLYHLPQKASVEQNLKTMWTHKVGVFAQNREKRQ
ncbi:MAG: hypothetical protein OXE86_14035 [Alphaproteobacteria bacterium]|nr:hypothetical protein [Alphaproteobacteria bacterium]